MITKVSYKISKKLYEELSKLCIFPDEAQEYIFKTLEKLGVKRPEGSYKTFPRITVRQGFTGQGVSGRVSFHYDWIIDAVSKNDGDESDDAEDYRIVCENEDSILNRLEIDDVLESRYEIENIPASLLISMISDYDNAGRYYCLTEEVETLKNAELAAIEQKFAKNKPILAVTRD